MAASRPAIAARDAAPPIALPGWHWAVQGGHCVRVTGRGCCVCLVCWRSHAHAHAADCAADHPDATKHRGPLARLNMHGRGKGGPLAIPPSTVIWPCVGIIRHLLEVPAREPTRGSAPASGGRNWRLAAVGWGGGKYRTPECHLRFLFGNVQVRPPHTRAPITSREPILIRSTSSCHHHCSTVRRSRRPCRHPAPPCARL